MIKVGLGQTEGIDTRKAVHTNITLGRADRIFLFHRQQLETGRQEGYGYNSYNQPK